MADITNNSEVLSGKPTINGSCGDMTDLNQGIAATVDNTMNAIIH